MTALRPLLFVWGIAIACSAVPVGGHWLVADCFGSSVLFGLTAPFAALVTRLGESQ